MLLEIWQDYRDESEKKSKGLRVDRSTLIFMLLNIIILESWSKGFRNFQKKYSKLVCFNCDLMVKDEFVSEICTHQFSD